jgi:hypothetical protein
LFGDSSDRTRTRAPGGSLGPSLTTRASESTIIEIERDRTATMAVRRAVPRADWSKSLVGDAAASATETTSAMTTTTTTTTTGTNAR